MSYGCPFTSSTEMNGIEVMRSMPCMQIGRDCAPRERKALDAALRTDSSGLPGPSSDRIARYPGTSTSLKNRLYCSVGVPMLTGWPILAEYPMYDMASSHNTMSPCFNTRCEGLGFGKMSLGSCIDVEPIISRW